MSEYIVRETGYPGTIKQEIVGELVRCKDCRIWDAEKYGYGWCKYNARTTHENWFCADGERKGEEDERLRDLC